MGNAEAKDFIPNKDESRRELDLSPNSITHERYLKHISGEYPDTCLKELPWHIRDAISLYEKLNVSFNCISALPPELPFRIPHLSHLDISHNQITTLPESICLLIHLEELLAKNNKINSLPTSFTQLSKLRKLDLSINELESLPETMGLMKSLEKINVSQNKLKSLPKSLGQSSILKIILAIGNINITNPPLNVCDSGSQQTLAFLKKKASLVNGSCDFKNNLFQRVRGNQVVTSVPNPHSARAQYVQLQTATMNTMSRIKTPLLPPYKATTYGPDELRDKIVGLIYGAVIGDAIGLATEFLSPDECQFHYDENNIRYSKTIQDSHRLHWASGDWTSTGDQMFLVLDSLLHWGGVVDELDFGQRLLEWRKCGVVELGDTEGYIPSGTVKLALQDPHYSKGPHSAAKRVLSYGSSQNGKRESVWSSHTSVTELADNGAASRAVILGIPHFHDIQEIISDSIRICMATNAAGPCWVSCSAISSVIALMLQGKYDINDPSGLSDLLDFARKACLQHIKDKSLEEELNLYFSCQDYKSLNLTEPGKQSYAFKPLVAGLIVLKSRKSFKEAISSIAMLGGHASVNASIAGAFLGCKEGFTNLPYHWISELLEPQQRWINTKINSLLDIMGLP